MSMKAITVETFSQLANDKVKIVFGHIDGMTSGSEYIIFMEQGGMRIAVQGDKQHFIEFFGGAAKGLQRK